MIITYEGKNFDIPELYQPLYNSPIKATPLRLCEDRLRTIIQADYGYNDGNLFKHDIVEWGSSLGYFSLSLACHTDKHIYGIDHTEQNILLSNMIKEKNNLENVFFTQGVTPQDVPDNIKSHIILSVLHHDQKGVLLSDEVMSKLKGAETIYLELAHCNEHPFWSNNLAPKETHFFSPFHYLQDILEYQFPNYVVKLIGVHSTHIGSVRPMFMLKRFICEEIKTDLFEGTIIDRFNLPYIDFGDFSLNSEGTLMHGCRVKEGINYAYALQGFDKYFLKFQDNNLIKVSKYIEGMLLSDIIKFGLLPYYDRFKIKKQLSVHNYENHKDPHPWNFIVNTDSDVQAIDYDEGVSSLQEDSVSIYLQILIQTI